MGLGERVGRGAGREKELQSAWRGAVFRVQQPEHPEAMKEQHQPSGERATIGYDGRIARPDRVDAVQYTPEPLHFPAIPLR